MSSANYKRRYVATYREIILVSIIFIVILFVLHPKDMLVEQILSEKSNYDLSMLYLRNMLKHDPTNESLMLALAKQSLQTGKKDLSYKLLGLLNESKNKEIKAEATILRFKLAKDDYFYIESKNQKTRLEQQYKKLQGLLKEIVSQHLYKEGDVLDLRKEALFLKDIQSNYALLRILIKRDSENIDYIRDAFYLANSLGRFKEALYYINRLIFLDKKNSAKWNEAKYFLYLDKNSYEKSEAYIKSQAKKSKFWDKKLLSFYLYNKKYKKLSNKYMMDFKNTTNFNKKMELWLKAINALRAGNYLKEAVSLGYKYENYFFNSKKARVELLRLYISSNDLVKAKKLSKKILKQSKR